MNASPDPQVSGRFSGKVAIVTGAASGIGAAVARQLAHGGATVVLADRNAAALPGVADGIGTAAPLDVTDAAACRALVAQAVAAHGALDYLCNIAGVLDMAPLADLDEERWSRLIDVNLTGAFNLCRAAMPHLVSRRGAIVNMASAAGLVGVPFNAGYVAAKHGLVGLTKALALEFAMQGVRVNAVCPTGVNTPMLAGSGAPAEGVEWALVMRAAPWLDGGTLCEPDDVADAVCFLLSEEARRVTGVAFPVDGGQTAG